MKNKVSDEDEVDFIAENFSPVENNRSSSEELKRIKKYSDANLNLIYLKLATSDEEEKRNIIVNLISALDYYVHEIIIWGIVQITLNQFPETKQYKRLEISIKYLKEFKEKDIFDDPKLKIAIIEKLRKNTYQKWENIKEGLSLVLPEAFHKKIGKLASEGKFQVADLKEINDKRNLIVHHFDREYKNESVRNDFDLDCQKSFDLIKLIIDSIHKIVEDYDDTQPENSN
jgi:hypothetical protein